MEKREYKIAKISNLGIYAVYYEKNGERYLMKMVSTQEEAEQVLADLA